MQNITVRDFFWTFADARNLWQTAALHYHLAREDAAPRIEELKKEIARKTAQRSNSVVCDEDELAGLRKELADLEDHLDQLKDAWHRALHELVDQLEPALASHGDGSDQPVSGQDVIRAIIALDEVLADHAIFFTYHQPRARRG